MSEPPASEPKQPASSLGDSPWFWLYVFSTAALVGLFLAGPKYFPRQTQLERQFLARQAGGQTVTGPNGETIAPPDGKNLIVTLGPLFLICGLLLVVAWSGLWWTRFFVKDQPADERDSGGPATETADESEKR